MKVIIVDSEKNISELNFDDLLKKSIKTILYFYPKDNTSGCTLEAMDFSKYKDNFSKLWIQVLGVSKDSENSHCGFIDKNNLWISLISDKDLLLHKKYWAWGEKKNYGKVYMGTIRSTFLVDSSGQVLKDRKNVKVQWHVVKVLEYISSLK